MLIINNGGETKEVTLFPDRSYTTFGPMVDLRIKGIRKFIRADAFSDYVIWKGGNLVVQRVNNGKRH